MARYALVIGIGENRPPLRPLTKTVGDATAIAQVLRDHGGFHVELLTQPQQVQYKALVTAIQTFVQQRAAGDEALIYYTGHGFPLVKVFGEMEAFLAPADCGVTLEDGQVTAQRNGLSLGSLNRLVARANFSNLVMLLDCCHSGYLLEDELLRQTFADFSRKDYWLMTACRSFEQAWANKSDPHSLFTGAVLAGLERSCADAQGIITAGRLFEFVQSRLRQEQQEVLQLSVGRPIELLRFQLEQPTIETDETVEPYRGLDAFTPETAEFFFGREDEIQSLVQKVHDCCFVPLIGASGSGKSSLVRAGLVPRLLELGWRVLEPIKPGSNPIAELKLALRSVFEEDEITGVYECIDRQDLATVLTGLPEPQRWLLVVDQFEEVFTLCTDRALKAAFIQTLTSAMRQETPRLTIVTTMRADFVEPCLAYDDLTKAIKSQVVYLGAMNREGLEAAIVQPAKRLNYGVEDRLLVEMLKDVETEANSLPLLQFALQQLWVQRDKEQRRLTYGVYQRLGGVAGALEQKADEVYQRLEANGQGDWVRWVLVKLVRTGEGTKDTRQRRLKTEFLEMGMDDATRQTIELVITALVDGRLLMSDRVNEQDVIDLSHEAIIQRWQRLVKWREQNRDPRRLLDRIEDAQRNWLKQGQKHLDLLQGRLLKDARRLLKQQPETVAVAKDFIRKSVTWQWRKAGTELVVLVVLVGGIVEPFLRDALVKQDYRQIESSVGDQGERAAVLDLAGGCWAQKPYAWMPAYFRERIFGNCRSLESANLEAASLDSVNLGGVNLSYANLEGASLINTNLSGSPFLGTNFSRTWLHETNLSETSFLGGNFKGAFGSVDLSRSRLFGVDLIGATLNGANLSNATLNGVNLSSASLEGADLKNVQFTCEGYRSTICNDLKNVKWDEKTQWQDIQGWDKAKNIPPALKKQLGLR
jgi:Caspase domain/Pentapeptide repeats (8 copies)